LQPLDGSIGLKGSAGGNVGQAAPGIVDQKQMDALASRPVVVVQPACVDRCDATFAVLGDDLLGAGLGLIGQLGESR
jgi:hypothetical protein